MSLTDDTNEYGNLLAPCDGGLELQFCSEGFTLRETYDKPNNFQRIRNRAFNRQWPNLPRTVRDHDCPVFHVGVYDGVQ